MRKAGVVVMRWGVGRVGPTYMVGVTLAVRELRWGVGRVGSTYVVGVASAVCEVRDGASAA